MEASSSLSYGYDDEERVLSALLDAFGSTFSINAIASAFCKAGRDADLTAEILCVTQGNISGDSINLVSNGESSAAPSSILLPESNGDNPTRANGNPKASKPKRNPASMGTVSCVIGKEYARPVTTKEACRVTKPLKLDISELPMEEIFQEDVSSNSNVPNDNLHKDIEDFLFKMLGSGFQLDMDMIRKVLGCCGYDVKKSLEKLFDLSASMMKKNDVHDISSSGKFADNSTKPKPSMLKEKAQHNGYARSQEKERHDLQREVLASLFSVPERVEEVPKRSSPVRSIRRSRAFGQVVSEPPRDRSPIRLSCDVEPQQDTEDEEEEESYQVLRRAAAEHWTTMKEYYKAAVDSFGTGDHALADKLLEQGQFFNIKAREADEKSSQAILQSRNDERREELVLDLLDHDKMEALRSLKVHLNSLAGIPCMHLKVILESNAEDTTRGSRKRSVLKFLEKESIKWTADKANVGTILINVEEIDGGSLSFGNKAL